MGNLSNIGRIFFGIAIAGMGIPVIYYKDLPYMLVPPKDYGLSGVLIITAGFIFILIGATLKMQSLVHSKNGICDKMDVTMEDGTADTYYFGVNTVFAKYPK